MAGQRLRGVGVAYAAAFAEEFVRRDSAVGLVQALDLVGDVHGMLSRALGCDAKRRDQPARPQTANRGERGQQHFRASEPVVDDDDGATGRIGPLADRPVKTAHRAQTAQLA